MATKKYSSKKSGKGVKVVNKKKSSRTAVKKKRVSGDKGIRTASSSSRKVASRKHLRRGR